MKYITFLFVLIFASCKGNTNSKGIDSLTSTHKIIDTGDYPIEIYAKGLESLYDKTKWLLYCIGCDKKLKFTEQSGIKDTNVTLGTLPLKLDQLIIRNDTIEIDLLFYYNNIQVNERLIEFSPLWGVVYLEGSDSVLCYSGRTSFRYFKNRCEDLKNCNDRSVVPLQPEVVRYIQDNKNRLDPWFRKEAIKRGVLKE